MAWPRLSRPITVSAAWRSQSHGTTHPLRFSVSRLCVVQMRCRSEGGARIHPENLGLKGAGRASIKALSLRVNSYLNQIQFEKTE